MGMHSGNKGKGFSEINVTPLVDVMLVLLIIFMMTAPLMFNGVDLQLPKTKAVTSLKLNSEQLILSITKEGDLYIKDRKLNQSSWLDELTRLVGDPSSESVFIRADHEVLYGVVAKIIASLKDYGFNRVSLVTEKDE